MGISCTSILLVTVLGAAAEDPSRHRLPIQVQLYLHYTCIFDTSATSGSLLVTATVTVAVTAPASPTCDLTIGSSLQHLAKSYRLSQPYAHWIVFCIDTALILHA